MTFRASLPRPWGPLALVTGFLLTASAMAQTYTGQSYSETPSVYSRRAAEPPVRRPARQVYPSPTARTHPQGAYSPRTARQPAARPRSHYPQPARQPRVADQRGFASQSSGSQFYGTRQAPGQNRAPAARPQPIRDSNVRPAFFPAPIKDPPSDAANSPKPEKVASIPAQLIAAPGEHQLLPAVRWAKTGLAKLDKIQDYSCTLVKRERISGTLGEHEFMFVKVRHEPFSVYVYFLGPARVKGQEAIYVQGENDGNILAHPNGIRKKIVGTVSLKPDSMLAMSGNRYPMTELGIKRLTQRLIEVGEHDTEFGECEVKVTPGAKINQRDCTCLQVVHPVPRREFLFHMAKIYVDSEHNLPIRYEAYEWPEEAGGAPVLTEEYTYLNLKLNNGFTDKDFDPNNPDYDFK